ncbi:MULTISPECIES: GspH/FimT family pseudopilin [Variovorax]|uniref:GspH/FimT family pseudopilin n=1 Tax=Variovorax TaxID=34072 RepID=UPI00285CE0ED|nr:GspH/FimT family protein [Variovorax sp. 3319]MDR6890698.1 type IV fimbrial biogenesis protein FimT [Variovorax sp. 3319]
MLSAKQQRGFSMVEVLAVVAVLSLMLAALAPGVMDWVRAARVRNAAEAVYSGLQKARIEAIKRNVPVTFWLVSAPDSGALPGKDCKVNAKSASWVVSLESPAGQCEVSPSTTTTPKIVATHGAGTVAAGVSVSGLANDGTTPAMSVTFNPLGQTTMNSAALSRINFDHEAESARKYSVQVSEAGDIRLCDRVVKNAGDPRRCA